MKILVFTTLFPNRLMPQHGLFVKHRVSALAENHEVRVVAPVPYFPNIPFYDKWFVYSQVPREENCDGLNVYHPRYFILPKVGRSFYGWFMFWSVCRFIRKLQKEFDFDCIDAHFIYPDGFAAVLLGKMFNKKVIVNARGSDINVHAQRSLLRKRIQYVLRNARAVVCVSESLRARILELGALPEKVHLIPNGIDHGHFYPTRKGQVREKLGLSRSPKMLLSVGHLLQAKGFDLLVQAVSLIRNENIVLYIIGEGPYRAKLEVLVEALKLDKRVIILSEVKQKDLCLWYNAADLFCLTSLREGRPNVVMESLACGTPVLSMDNWGLKQYVTKDAGILLDGYGPAEIAAAMVKAVNRVWDQEKIAESVKDLTWEKTAENMDAVIAGIQTKSDVVFFSSDDFHSGLKTSKFHLSTRLAKENRVIFINSLSLRAPKVSGRDLSKIIRKLKQFFKGTEEVRKNLFVYTPILIPFQRFQWVRSLNKVFLKWQMARLYKQFNLQTPDVWTFLPNSVDLVKDLPRRKLIYYVVDDMSAFTGVAREVVQQQDKDLRRAADILFSVSQELLEQKAKINANSFYSPHGVDFELFHQAVTIPDIERPADLAGINGPVIGFYGLISNDWVDYQLLAYLAQARPEYQFVLIGKRDGAAEEFPKAGNIHYLGVKEYEDLYKYSRFFDVAILPFQLNDLTRHSHPLKILEYLSAGCPVVSVNIPEAGKYRDVIEVANDYDEFLNKIEQCLTRDTNEKKQRRVEFASRNSWDQRYETVIRIINGH